MRDNNKAEALKKISRFIDQGRFITLTLYVWAPWIKKETGKVYDSTCTEIKENLMLEDKS